MADWDDELRTTDDAALRAHALALSHASEVGERVATAVRRAWVGVQVPTEVSVSTGAVMADELERELVVVMDALVRDVEAYAQVAVGIEQQALEVPLSRAPRPPAVRKADAARVARDAMASPLEQSRASVPALDELVRELPKAQGKRIDAIVRVGVAQGSSVEEIARATRDTADLVMEQGRAVAHTVVMQTAQTAREATWEANSDIVSKYKIVATLDRRTSAPCRALDGQVFEVGKGPQPPFHLRCRTTTRPVLDEAFAFLQGGGERPAVGPDGASQVPAERDYYSWLKTQPRAFVEDVLGKKRGALLLDSGLTAEEFRAVQLSRDFAPLTLDQLRARVPRAFERLDAA